jgi:hypothetical protein
MKSKDPKLGALADNGGPTKTMAIALNSPARNAGDGTATLPFDQRGVPRPGNGVCDIGAYQISGPFIVIQPQNLVRTNGQAATFTVVAFGDPPLRYQWQFDGTNINTATNSTYTIASVSATNAGTYDVVITNSVGSITSALATLTVVSGPAITTQPSNTVAMVGSNATFTVTASGDPPLTYQWSFNGTNLAGATSNVLTLTNVQLTNAGTYVVVVTNGIGSVTSAPATLRVIAPAALSQVKASSNSLSFSFPGQTGFTYVVEFKTNLTSAQWTPLTTNVPGASGPVTNKVLTTNGPMRFYRVRIQ